jgi:ApbE superfamily uncharacterized protein (UPF0280 family)
MYTVWGIIIPNSFCYKLASMTKSYEERTYRNLIKSSRLQTFTVVVQETDLCVHARTNLEDITKELVLEYRGYLEAYIRKNPDFARTMQPWRLNGPAPNIVDTMVRAGEKAGVGPMASVAGAIAESVGRDLLGHTDEVIVENGGDIFLKTSEPITIGIYAGNSPLSLKLGLRVDSSEAPLAVCTSSGTVGHSLSLGKADAVCVVSDSCPLADAVATSIGNLIQTKRDIQQAVETGKLINGIKGLAIILDDDIGLWGELDLAPLKRKKG